MQSVILSVVFEHELYTYLITDQREFNSPKQVQPNV